MTRTVTRNLNKIIDVNYYPVETAKKSNMRHRPIGLGTQGLADAFLLLGMAFDSPEVSGLGRRVRRWKGRGLLLGIACDRSRGEGSCSLRL